MDTQHENKEAITAIIEDLFSTVQTTKELPEALKAMGGIEALVAFGLATGVISEPEADIYIDRGLGLASLIQEKIIAYNPIAYLPESADDMSAEKVIETLIRALT